MKEETKNCQNCKAAFAITADDFLFYEKIQVPPPTFCPECRLQRRLVWMKGIELFKRKCDLCQEIKFSMYRPDAPYVVYCDRCYWSDTWDAKDFGMTYDPTRQFLEQWNELLHKTPLLGLSIDKGTGETSPYTNHVGNSKNCYLLFYAENNEDSAYGYYLLNCKNTYDSSPVIECENSYDCGNIFKSYNIVHCFNARHDVDCSFLSDCDGCTHCFGSMNLKNTSYVFFNEKLSKEEYENKMATVDLGSFSQYEEWKKKAHEHWKMYPPRPVYDDFSIDSTGSYYFECKNSKECYEVVNAEDSKFLMLVKAGKVRDSYDYTDWGFSVDRAYECMTVGDEVKEVYFSHEAGFGLFDVQYSKLSTGASHHFGCVSVRKTEYCILNKQYSKEEYETLKAKIIEDMRSNPYISADNHTYSYGEFFPPEFSPHAYNDSFASRFFPLTEEEVHTKGMRWYVPEKKEYDITMLSKDIPDHIRDVKESILSEIIGCSTCSRGFRVIPQELQYLQQHNLPFPRRCPFCRIWEKIDRWVQNMRLHDRTCNTCARVFKTHYDSDRAPYILCKECYLKEVL